MRGRLLIVTVLVVAGALVAALNWEAMAAGVGLSLIFTEVTVSVGALVALVAATLVIVFLLAGLIDRATHLRQLSQLERHLEEARAALAKKRSADLDALGQELAQRLDAVAAGVDGALARLEERWQAQAEGLHEDLGARLDAVRERVVVVRDELAADIAEVEDALLRERRAGAAPAPEPFEAPFPDDVEPEEREEP
jgi:DNA anti-recombination protein RmuC